MQKSKRTRFVLAYILMFSMMAMYGFIPTVKAASLTSAKTTISDSDLSATDVTYTVTYKPGVEIQTGSIITLAIDSNIDITSADGTCTNGTWASTTNTVTCEATSAISATSTITITGVTNPVNSGDYTITISHNQGEGESSQMIIYIIDDVTVSASVDASLTFAIGTTTDSVLVDTGVTTTGTGTPTSIDFGTVQTGSGGRQIIAQSLTVSTNASAGYVVTVQQDHDLNTGVGADINAYSTTTEAAWDHPAGTLTDDTTYGHMALTSSDDDYFTDNNYRGLDGTTAMAVMTHTGPADGLTAGVGQAYVAYSIEITDLQEAGDYSNTLTYICTPTY